MEEYGIMELFRAITRCMRAEDGKQEIYLEWPKGLRSLGESYWAEYQVVCDLNYRLGPSIIGYTLCAHTSIIGKF